MRFFKDRNTRKVQISDNIALPVESTRELTPEGYLKATAAITRVGVQHYSAREFGVDSDDLIGVFRPPETVFHQETIDSIKLKPITFFHPDEEVNSKNANRLQVGTVGEKVEAISSETLGASIQITDDDIVKQVLGREVEELSLGYDCYIVSEAGEYNGETYIYKFDGPMINNHLAIVPEGRCGDSVKILDGGDAVKKRQAIKALRDAGVSEEKIKLFMSSAKDDDDIQGADLKEYNKLLIAAQDIDMGALVPAIVAELKPSLEEMVKTPEFTSSLAKEIAAGMGSGTGGEDQENYPVDPEMDAKAMDAKIKDQAQSRAALIGKATPFIQDKEFKIFDAEEIDIVKKALAAVGIKDDAVKDKSIEYLTGQLDAISKDRVDAIDFSNGKSFNDSADTSKLSAPMTGIGIRNL